ncbi:MAG: MBL fold metallo-hydrolase [Ignavibacteriae bacterium]|nr:MAG: MBL fold metallo-hydrolase [Ignavibacteriota bacterium]
MNIRIWGARGSIPVSGMEYIKYGGDTTCVEIRTQDDEIIIIDAGSGIRRLGNKLFAEQKRHYHLIFTHAHWDHLMGFPFFKPIYFRETQIDMFGCPFAQASIQEFLKESMSPPHFPVKLSDLKAVLSYHGTCSGAFNIGSVQISPIFLSHPNQGIGYKFIEQGKSFVFITDNELSFQHPGGLEYKAYADFSRDADLLIHDAEFTDQEYVRTKGWGHSLYRDALQLASDAGVKRFGMFHHNHERDDAAVDEIVQNCQSILHEQRSMFDCFAVHQGMEIEI